MKKLSPNELEEIANFSYTEVMDYCARLMCNIEDFRSHVYRYDNKVKEYNPTPIEKYKNSIILITTEEDRQYCIDQIHKAYNRKVEVFNHWYGNQNKDNE